MTLPALLLALAVLCSVPVAMPVAMPDSPEQQVAAARAVFERNLRAIQERDREGYLACYLPTDALVRSGPTGFDLGFEDLAAGTSASGSDDWPRELVARDLSLTFVRDGVVYGTYRYQTDFDGGPVVSGLSERLFVRTDDGWRIAVTTAFGATEGVPAAPLALVGATLHDGSGGAPIEDAVVVTRDGRIESAGPRATTPVPEGVEVLDLSGRHVMPGLVDAHVHYGQTGWIDGRPDAWDARDDYPYAATVAELERRPERLHRAFLASGVTAVFDVGGYPWSRGLGERTELSELAPHVSAAGPLLTTWAPEILMLPDQQQFVLVETPEQARAAVRSHAASGSDAIKLWFIIDGPDDVARHADMVRALGAEADAVGLPLLVHATEREAARLAVEAGAELLVHSVDDQLLDEAFLVAMTAQGTIYCPTLVVEEGYYGVFGRTIPDAVRTGLGHVHPDIRARVERTVDLPPDPRFAEGRLAAAEERYARSREVMAANLRAVHEAGVPVALGTDAGNPLTLHGPSIFREAEAMEAAGMTAADVLVSATRDAARAMGRGDDLGVIAAGRIADLLVLEQDPSVLTAHWRSITHVMRAGTLHRRETLNPAHAPR